VTYPFSGEVDAGSRDENTSENASEPRGADSIETGRPAATR
jgi:hypothetical protein